MAWAMQASRRFFLDARSVRVGKWCKVHAGCACRGLVEGACMQASLFSCTVVQKTGGGSYAWGIGGKYMQVSLSGGLVEGPCRWFLTPHSPPCRQGGGRCDCESSCELVGLVSLLRAEGGRGVCVMGMSLPPMLAVLYVTQLHAPDP
eukprot:1156390-Pelagomonas_calceolata.AAC.3